MSGFQSSLPNTACTRLVGVCAFSGIFCGLSLVPAKSRYLVPPTSRVTQAVSQFTLKADARKDAWKLSQHSV